MPNLVSPAAILPGIESEAIPPSARLTMPSQPIDPLQHPHWDAWVVQHPDFSFFHGAAWAKVLVETYGFTPRYFTTGGPGRIHSLLPLMEADSWLTGRRGIALPFTDSCEPFFLTDSLPEKLLKDAVDFGRARGWKYLECRGGRKLSGQVPVSVCFYGHRLDLTLGEDKLFAGLKASVRQAVRKAEQAGVTVEISDSLEALKIFYQLQCLTRQKHGLPPQPFAFFGNIHRHILARKSGMIAVARHGRIPIAASVYFHLNGRAVFKYGAANDSYQHLRGVNLAMWEAIKWHVRQGMCQLHLGRTSLANAGLRRFKLAWGAREETIEYFKYDLRREVFVTDRDESSGWHNYAFQRLPLWASRVIGNVLYRHWA